MTTQFENLNLILINVQKAQFGIKDIKIRYQRELLGSSRVKSMALAGELLERISEIIEEEMHIESSNK